MGHLMETVNPEAAKRMANEGRPIPAIGEMVLYVPRKGEIRRGRDRVPAIVIARDEDNRHLTLIVLFEAQDFGDQERVPEHVEGERGWLRMPSRAMEMITNYAPAEIKMVQHDLAELRAVVLGEFEVPPRAVLELIDALDERVDTLESATHGTARKAPPKKAVKKKGR